MPFLVLLETSQLVHKFVLVITQSIHLNIYIQEVTTDQNIFGALIKSMINARIQITIFGNVDYFT